MNNIFGMIRPFEPGKTHFQCFFCSGSGWGISPESTSFTADILSSFPVNEMLTEAWRAADRHQYNRKVFEWSAGSSFTQFKPAPVKPVHQTSYDTYLKLFRQ